MKILTTIRYYCFDLPIKRAATLDKEGIKQYSYAGVLVLLVTALFTYIFFDECYGKNCDSESITNFQILGGILLLLVYAGALTYYGYFNRDKIDTTGVKKQDMEKAWSYGIGAGGLGYWVSSSDWSETTKQVVFWIIAVWLMVSWALDEMDEDDNER